jgi:hypothetical protein
MDIVLPIIPLFFWFYPAIETFLEREGVGQLERHARWYRIMVKQKKGKDAEKATPPDCESCKFNINMDDDKMKCEFAKMLGKREPGCEKYEQKA